MNGRTPEEIAMDGAIYDPRWMLRRFADVESSQVRWLVPGFVPLRAFTLVAGVGGLGKSTWLIARAAELSRSRKDTIVISFEDTAAEVIRPRLLAAGADLDHVHEMALREPTSLETLALPRDLDELRDLVRSVKARLVVIDPLVAALETSFDAHKDQHVRHVLGSLVRIAEEEDAAVAGVGHLNKAPSTDAYIRVANSVAFWNAARSVVLITEDGDDDESRLVAQRKANWARLRPVERHRLEEIVLPDEVDPETGESIVTSRIVFVDLADDVVGADLLQGKPTKANTAETLLSVLLADGDWHEAEQIKVALKAADISEPTAKRAAAAIGVEFKREGFPSVGLWRLPQGGSLAVGSQFLPTCEPTVNSAQPGRSASHSFQSAHSAHATEDDLEWC